MADNDIREELYKVLVVGDIGAGKTSIIKRYVHNMFSMHYKSTIGVDFALKVIQWDPKTIVRLQLWDIAGQERFGNMTRVYYKEAVGAMVVFDITRQTTFDAVLKWKRGMLHKPPRALLNYLTLVYTCAVSLTSPFFPVLSLSLSLSLSLALSLSLSLSLSYRLQGCSPVARRW
eukprot:TRINITY_DN289_c0_g1_i2.p1 TRINITY_DN289_c0_g1~~TRINITY_DN289_c0_g1_i2.p1  ORF type:complete len:174 (+),score=40.71 TRINITY_DN289_c0_g1_i2:277-798(+)